MTDWTPTDEDAFASLDGLASALLPGNDVWPSGGSLDLGRRMARRATDSPRFRAAIQAFLSLREPGLAAAAGTEDRNAALQALQARDPEIFTVLIMSVYDAYYTHRQILDLIGEHAGIRSGPPQPEGHTLKVEPYRDIGRVRDSGVLWRDDGESIARSVRAEQEADPARVWTEEEISSWSK